MEEPTQPVRLTKKGLPDKRVESAKKNMKKARDIKSQIFQEHKEKKQLLSSSTQIPVNDNASDSSDSSYDSDASDEIIIQSKKMNKKVAPKITEPVPQPVAPITPSITPGKIKSEQDKRIEDIESMLKLIVQGAPERKKREKKKTVIQIEQPQPQPQSINPPKQSDQFESVLKHKILNF